METPPRVFKPHGALEALQRGSPAYKERLYKRAFARVEKSRAAILSKARGIASGSGAREQVRHILEDEAEAMELDDEEVELWRGGGGGGGGGGEDMSYADIPADVYREYEEFLYSLCEQLERDLDAERYEEFERFDEAALEAAISQAEAAMHAMDLSD